MNQEISQREWVLLGGGHTHLHILRMWHKHPIPGVRLTCVSNQADATYSGMLPGTLAGNYQPQQARIDLVRRCAAVGARLILAETTGLDRAGKRLLLRDRPPLPYDWLSIGIGSQPAPVQGAEHAVSIKPMQSFLQRLDQRMRASGQTPGGPLRVVVVGGGAGGVEIACCLPTWVKNRFPDHPLELTIIHRGKRILKGGSDSAAHYVQKLFDDRGYQTRLGHSVVAIEERGVVVETPAGERHRLGADVVLWAVDAVDPSLFQAFDLAKDAKGFLLTNIYLQSVDEDSIFVVGDSGTCPQRPHPKAGVYAVRQGPVLWDNVCRAMHGKSLSIVREITVESPLAPAGRGQGERVGKASVSSRTMLREWKPQSHFLSLLNTGNNRAILQYRDFAAYGRWCWWLKDAIDRRFMSKHQDDRPR